MTDAYIQAWQERHTFECPHLKARITPEQCESNRARKGGWSTTGNEPHKINQCERCTEYDALIKTVAERLPKEAKTVAKRGTCKCCGRGPYSLTGGLCGECSKHRADGELIREGDEWVWLIPVPGYVGGEEPKSEECHAPVKPKYAGVCAGCDREVKQIVGRGLCAACYRYAKDGRLRDNGDGTYTWTVEPPGYVMGGVPREDDAPTDHELDTPQEGTEERFIVPMGVDMVAAGSGQYFKITTDGTEEPKACDKCACPGPCPHAEVGEPERPSPAPDTTVIQVGGMTLTRHITHRSTSTNKPFAAVRKNAKGVDLALNAVTVIKFGLTKAKYVDVYSDAAAQVLALVPLDEPTDGDSVLLRSQDGNTRIISATGVLRDLGVTEAGRYKVTGGGGKPGIVLVDFKERAA